MPLERRNVAVTLQAELDEGTDPKSLQRGQLLAAENVRWSKEGRVSKRNGHSAVFTAPNTGEGRLVPNGKELLLFDGKSVVSYPGVGSTANTICPATPFSGESFNVHSPKDTAVASCSARYVSGSTDYTVVVWVTQSTYGSSAGGDVYARVYNTETMAPVVTTGLTADKVNSVSAVHNQPNCFVVGSLVVVTYKRATSTEIYQRTFDTATGAWASQVTLASANVSGSDYDAKPLIGSTTKYLLSYLSTGFSSLVVRQVTASTGVAGFDYLCGIPSAWPPTYYPSGIGVSGVLGEKVFVTCGWDADDGNGVRLRVSRHTESAGVMAIDGSFPLVVATPGNLGGVTNEVCVTSGSVKTSSSTDAELVYSYHFDRGGTYLATTGAWYRQVATASISLSGTTAATPRYSDGIMSVTPPFENGGRYFFAGIAHSGEWGVLNDSTPWGTAGLAVNAGGYHDINQATAALYDTRADLTTGGTAVHLAVASFFPAQLTFGERTSGATTLFPAMQYVAPSYKQFCLEVSDSPQFRKSVKLVRLTDSDGYRWDSYFDGYGAVVSGGLVASYDRGSIYPVGFLTEPATRIGEYDPAGGTIADVTYLQTHYERVDGTGRVARGGTDFGVKKGTGGDGRTNGVSVVANFDPSTALARASFCVSSPAEGWDAYSPGSSRTRLAVFTAASDTNNLKRLDPAHAFFTALAAGIGGSYLVNCGILTAPPTANLDAELPYTLGDAELPHCQPPCFLSMVHWDGRLWGIDHTRRQVWFSNDIRVGEVPSFTLDYTIVLPFDAFALGAMEDKLVVFGKNQLGCITGSGPDRAGNGSRYSGVVGVSTDVGCVEPRSVLATPSGLFFQGPADLCFVDRGLNVSHVGRKTIDTLASYPTVTSAVLHPTETVALFTCTSSDGTAGRRIVFDYRLNRWSVDSIGDGLPVLSQAVCNGNLYLLLGDGRVVREDSTTHLDLGDWVTMRVKFAPERLAGLLGYQRVWKCAVIGDRVTDHDLTVRMYGDDRTTPDQTRSFPSATTALTATGSELVQLRLKRQLCSSIAVEVADYTPTGGTVGTGAGPTISGMAIEVGVESDQQRVPATRRV